MAAYDLLDGESRRAMHMSEHFEGRVAVITGGATGIGHAVARALVNHGASVVLASRDRERGDRVARAVAAGSGRAVFERADVRLERDVERLFQRAVDAYGRVDFIFNNAGIEGPSDDMAELGKEALDELLSTNIKGVLFCLKYGLPRILDQGGVVVNAGSFIGTTLPFPRAVVYGATKAAVLSVTRSVAAGLTPHNVGVFAVCPWITDTPMIDRLAGHNSVAKAQFGQMNPSGRIVAPDDVAEAVVSIFAGQSGLVSGDAVLVDSGGALQTIAPMLPDRVLTTRAREVSE
jgi:NAD(P)-dependent dehydrogenase (short-subunit alcohol dehydrogenase family)